MVRGTHLEMARIQARAASGTEIWWTIGLLLLGLVRELPQAAQVPLALGVALMSASLNSAAHLGEVDTGSAGLNSCMQTATWEPAWDACLTATLHTRPKVRLLRDGAVSILFDVFPNCSLMENIHE